MGIVWDMETQFGSSQTTGKRVRDRHRGRQGLDRPRDPRADLYPRDVSLVRIVGAHRRGDGGAGGAALDQPFLPTIMVIFVLLVALEILALKGVIPDGPTGRTTPRFSPSTTSGS